MTSAGAWYTLKLPDGYVKKFQPSKWTQLISTDDEFKQRVIRLMDEEIIQKAMTTSSRDARHVSMLAIDQQSNLLGVAFLSSCPIGIQASCTMMLLLNSRMLHLSR